MKRLSGLINGSSKELYLDESFLIDNDNPFILVNKATLFWDYNNITDENN